MQDNKIDLENKEFILRLAACVQEVASELQGEVPSLIASPELKIETQPYSQPMRMSAGALRDAISDVSAYSAVAALNTVKQNGAGILNLGLPGYPGVATSPVRRARYCAVHLQVTVNDQVNQDDFSLGFSGVLANNVPYGTPQNALINWASGDAKVGRLVYFVTNNLPTGPALQAGQLTTIDFPSQETDNGAGASATARAATITISSAAAAQGHSARPITVGDGAWNDIRETIEKLWMISALSKLGLKPIELARDLRLPK